MSQPRTVTTPAAAIFALALGLALSSVGGLGPIAGATASPTDGDQDVLIELPPTVTVQPSVTTAAATCDTSATYTLSGEPEIIWLVDGTETAPGTHPVTGARTMLVEAAPYLGAFAPGIRTEWNFSIAAPPACGSDEAAAVPPSVGVPAQTTAPRATAAPAPTTAPATDTVDPAPAAPAETDGAELPTLGLPSESPSPAVAAPDDADRIAEEAAVELPTLALASDTRQSSGPASLAPLALLLLSGAAVLLAAVGAGRPGRTARR